MPFLIKTEVAGLLHLVLNGTVSAAEMELFRAQHNAAIAAFRGADYRVFCDIRGLMPLPPEAATIFAEAKAVSAAASNFRGSAVLADGALVAMQHKRTSIAGGVIDTELITDDEAAAAAHLAQVDRRPRPRWQPR